MKNLVKASCFFILFSCVFFSVAIPLHAQENNRLVPRTYFGMHIHRLTRGTNWPSVPFYSMRLLAAGVEWPFLEPEKGKFNFSLLDTYVNIAQQNNIDIVLPLVFSPQWASARPYELSAYKKPGFAAEPNDINDWKNYIKELGVRYKGKIKYYEIWNEPDVKLFYSGSVEQMVFLTKVAYDTLKSIDPNIKIISPSATGKYGYKWLDDFLNKGGDKYIDIIGYHFYVMPGPPENIIPLIQKVKNVMRKHSLTLPLWNTEAGWDRQRTFTDDEAAAYVARSYILNWTEGVQRFYWYAWDDTNWIGLRMTRDDNKTITPAGTAYAQIQNWLIGRSIDSCSREENGVWMCSISSKSTRLGVIMWSEKGTQVLQLRNAMYSVLEQLDGASKKLEKNKLITISSIPVFLHIDGLTNPHHMIKKNIIMEINEDAPLVIKDKSLVIRNTPFVIK